MSCSNVSSHLLRRSIGHLQGKSSSEGETRLSFLNHKHVNIFQMCITGGLGIPASNRERSPSGNALVCTEYIRVGSLSIGIRLQECFYVVIFFVIIIYYKAPICIGSLYLFCLLKCINVVNKLSETS